MCLLQYTDYTQAIIIFLNFFFFFLLLLEILSSRAEWKGGGKNVRGIIILYRAPRSGVSIEETHSQENYTQL